MRMHENCALSLCDSFVDIEYKMVLSNFGFNTNSRVLRFNHEKKFEILTINVSVRKCEIQNRNSLLHADQAYASKTLSSHLKFQFKENLL